ncbi:cold shock domain-containing protein [Mucilaginibacter sp. RS28]|uniref:Cold shock domain-containing protein n=1 Tax=Mucilaginibacter straminoryzae TaxID=2932774 RepID=A0A9X2B848_9SPHI|nr:cold shock domain-containing protein [Mucilaginibacter straminoryzae]MCJ8209249.1 cold shock domain-containing protein [Mucilaginibacter straminoryzae]
MGKSSETFSKKEKEKKRLKKQQDKKEKAAERKANSDKGKSLEDMMAYIDENGNITSTPPDPTKKKKIALEDIEIGVSRQPDVEVDPVRKGTVTFFNSSKGYGFIKDLQTQESVFVHFNGLLEQVDERDKVTFEVERGPKGLNAIKVKKAV